MSSPNVRTTLVRVLLIQIITLAALWYVQTRYGA